MKTESTDTSYPPQANEVMAAVKAQYKDAEVISFNESLGYTCEGFF